MPKTRGFTLLEVMVAMALMAIMGSSIIYALAQNERYAAQARLMTNARAIVQRNIELAQGVKWTKAMAQASPETNTPAILMPTTGTTWDDDGGGDNAENIAVLRNSNTVLVSGTLMRTVQNVNNDPTVRKVTFTVSYKYRGVGPGGKTTTNFSYSASTIRSTDD